MRFLFQERVEHPAPLTEHAVRGLAKHGERLRHDILECLPAGQTLAELGSLAGKLLIAQRCDALAMRIDLGYNRTQLLDVTVLLGAEEEAKHGQKIEFHEITCG